ncbi:AMP-binding protein [Streptomyces sp. NPDC000134]|uniref:AMP-binding protein n=1 Tax=Streptomyces sp. NPDC000134 TaxID=3364536 RepID=UPI0036BB8737
MTAAPEPSQVRGPSHPPLLQHTIGEVLRRTAREFPDHEAVVECWSGRRWTYHDLLAEAEALARGLLLDGVAKGDRVGVWSPNSAEWIITQYATALVGAILVPVNPAYRASEMTHVVRQSGMSALVTAAEYKGSVYPDLVRDVSARCPRLRWTVVAGGDEWHELLRRGRTAGAGPLAEAERRCAPADAINIQYTSGTSGLPKGATLTHQGLLNNARDVGAALGYDESDRLCLSVPLFHCFGMVLGSLACLTAGAAVVLPSPGFEAPAALEATERERCTSQYGVPTMFLAQVADPGFARYDLSSLRTGLMAGAPCPPSLLHEVVTRMGVAEITTSYGLTEASPTVVQSPRTAPPARRFATAGTPLPHVEVKVTDTESGRILPRGDVGEICVRGYLVMRGYWEQPEQTAAVIDEEGWLHTGDLGTVTPQGCLAVTGRISDMVIRGGENVYPREVEDCLLQHPDVVEVAVVGVPDANYGEQVMAWIRQRPGSRPLDAPAVREFCAGRIAHYKIPRYVRHTAEFPTTANGKIRKVALREAAEADQPEQGG